LGFEVWGSELRFEGLGFRVCLVGTPPTESANTALSCAPLKEAKEASMPSISGRVRATPPAGRVLLAVASMVPVVSHAHSLHVQRSGFRVKGLGSRVEESGLGLRAYQTVDRPCKSSR